MSPRLASATRFDALWRRGHAGAGALAPAPLYAELVGHYTEPQRRYHTLDHIDHCLQRFDGVAELMQDPDAVELALWFHDVIFDPDASDNERRSAELYLAWATGASARFRRHVCSMILTSRHAQAARGVDHRYVVDIDLAGFGLPWAEFRRQTDLVRAEYPRQSDAEFAAGLAPFLVRLIARPRFFATDFFRDRYESAARANIASLLDEWERAGYVSRSV